jgi:hypothetical protein
LPTNEIIVSGGGVEIAPKSTHFDILSK